MLLQNRHYTVLSLGAGVQSTTLLLMALHGEFERLMILPGDQMDLFEGECEGMCGV